MRPIPTLLRLSLAGLGLFAAAAGALETGLVDTEGAIRTWRSTDGLPSDSVMAVIQTRDGYLWIGTSAGLVRFDGVKFTGFNLDPSSTNRPPSVTALCEDREGHLWIGTQQDGLFELTGETAEHYTKARGLLDDSVTSLATDSQGFIWIGTKAGLNLATGRDFRALTTREGLSDSLVSGVHVARSGTVWITTRAGMCQFVNGRLVQYAFQTDSQGRSPEYLGAYEDRRGNLWAFGDTYLINLATEKRFNYFRGTEAASVRIWSLCEGRDGRLWIGTSGRGLFCFDDNRFQPVILGELRWPYDVRAICEDREGNLWLGTSGGGLVQLRPQPVHVLRVAQGLPTSLPTALAADAAGHVYVGLQRGGLFVSEAGRFDRLPGAGGFEVQEFVSSLAVGLDGTVWSGTLGGGLYGLRNPRGIQLTTANGLADDTALATCVDAAGAVWLSTRAGTLHRLHGETLTRFGAAQGLNGAPIVALLPTPGGLLAGTQDGTVLRGTAETFTVLQPGSWFRHRPVLAMFQDREKRLWAGSAGGGLTCWFNGATAHWTTENGLPSDLIAAVAEDANGNLWLATGAGIFRAERALLGKAIEHQSPLLCKLMSDARTGIESATVVGGPRALLAADGKLWFATSEGILNVDARRPEIEAVPLPVFLESVSINGGPMRPPPRGQTPAEIFPGALRSLEIHFTALNFTTPEKVRFRHQLEGFDVDWGEESSERFTRYGRLPYGHYRFRLAARVADGAWQEVAHPLVFTVPAPLYFQAWAIALYVITAIALVAVIVRVVSHRRLRVALARLEQQQTLERERMRIARDMHDEIGSKLTKISFLSEHARVDAEPSGPLAGKIATIAAASRELLKTMDEIVWVVNPRNDTLENLAAYLSHHAEEYFQNTSVECEMRLPRALPHHPLSSEVRHNLFLAFEEALNNVLKHSGAAKVKVEMALREPAEFEIMIQDNGRGFAAAAPATGKPQPHGARGGNGLRNMRQRLADIGGECRVQSRPGEGTIVTLRIRLNLKATSPT